MSDSLKTNLHKMRFFNAKTKTNLQMDDYVSKIEKSKMVFIFNQKECSRRKVLIISIYHMWVRNGNAKGWPG